MTKAGERELVKVEHVNGGAGFITREQLVSSEEVGEACRMYAKISVLPNCEIGYHEHHGESETYYIIQGQGEYNDNGKYRPVKAGDITFTPDNHGHGLANTGNTDLVFMALIIKD